MLFLNYGHKSFNAQVSKKKYDFTALFASHLPKKRRELMSKNVSFINNHNFIHMVLRSRKKGEEDYTIPYYLCKFAFFIMFVDQRAIIIIPDRIFPIYELCAFKALYTQNDDALQVA